MMARCDWCDQAAKDIGLSFGDTHVCVDCCACGVTLEKTMSRVGLFTCGYPPGYTRRLEDELRAAQLRIEELRAERDAWAEEAGRRGLALATVEAKYAALLELCAEFALGNREER